MTNKNIFIGPYLRIWMPKIDIKNRFRTCVNKDCVEYRKKNQTGIYCSLCGRKIDTVEVDSKQTLGLYELLDEEYSNGDLFRSVDVFSRYILAVPNNLKRQGGKDLNYENGIEFDYPNNLSDFYRSDWNNLMRLLESKNIKYEKCNGILHWFY